MTEDAMLAVNKLSRDAFIARYGSLYANADWAAAEAYACRPFVSLKALNATLSAMIGAAPQEAQRRVLRGYVGLETLLAVASGVPQAPSGVPAGLDRLAPEIFAQFRSLNKAYEHRFDMPFILDMTGLEAIDVMAALESRLQHKPEVELHVALQEITRMAEAKLLTMPPVLA